MRCSVGRVNNLTEIVEMGAGVNANGRQVLVPQQVAHRALGSSARYKANREGVTQAMKGDSLAACVKPFVEAVGEVRAAGVAVAAIFCGEEERAGLGPVEEQGFEALGHGDDARVFRFAGDGEVAVLEVDGLPPEIDGFVAAEAGVGGEDGEEVVFGGGVVAEVGEEGFEFGGREVFGDGALHSWRFDAVGGELVEPAAGAAPAEEGNHRFDVVADGGAGAEGETLVAPFGDLVGRDFVQRSFGADLFGELGDDGAVAFVGAGFACGAPVFAPVHGGCLEIAGVADGGLLGFDFGGVGVGFAFAVFGERFSTATAAGEPIDDPGAAGFVEDDGGHALTLQRVKLAANCNRKCNQERAKMKKLQAGVEFGRVVARLGIEPRTLSARFLGVRGGVLGVFCASGVASCVAECNQSAIAGGAS